MKRVIALLSVIFVFAACCLGCAENADNPASSPEAPEPSPTITPAPTPVYTPAPLPTPVTFPAKGYCNGEGVNLRAEPDTKSTIVDIMGENAALSVAGLQDGWYKINLGGQEAYVAERLVTLGEPPRRDNMNYGKTIVTSAPLYITPSESDISDKALAMGDTVKILRNIGEYLHIVYDGSSEGLVQRYVHKDAIEYIPIEEYLAARDAAAPAAEAEGEAEKTE